jgi:5-methylcytosine-specific restriction protein A
VKLLRASHIKPWRDSNNFERLDPYNGLPLAPGYDAAFDEGFITFNSIGGIVISEHLSSKHLLQLGISRNARIEKLGPRQLAYLEYHRAEVFENS